MNAPKVTPADLEAEIVSEHYFDAEIGKRIARENAIEQLWPLLGFRLADKLHAVKHAQCVIDDMDREDLEALARPGTVIG